jgi:sodium/proline symporter
MQDQITITLSFAFFLIAFTAIGAIAARFKQDSSEDYLLAGRSVNPWLVALSAVSTNNSGYMFIGLIGFTWRSGLEAVWITFGWILGDLLTWFWVHKRVRSQSEHHNVASVPALLATDKHGKTQRPIAIVAGLLTLFFLGGYAAAQLKAGSATLHAIFGWPLWLGAVLGVVIVTIYCISGGIRASIWTDAAQSIVMIGAMSMLVIVCMLKVGGPTELFAALQAIDPKLVALFPSDLAFGFGLYFLAFIFAGITTIGQPHILVRFMAIDATDSIAKARWIYFIWYTFFSAAAFTVGLYARVLLPDITQGLSGAAAIAATESALPNLSLEMLPPVLIGVMLAGLFSATMSTADSQILSCSAAVTQDIAPQWKQSYSASKIATLGVALLALIIALYADSGVFSLVLIAWSALGATLGPILIVRLAGKPLPNALALLMMGVGLAVIIFWGNSPWSGAVFKAMPGFIAPLIVYALATLIFPKMGDAQR